jgi:hypothetical protein
MLKLKRLYSRGFIFKLEPKLSLKEGMRGFNLLDFKLLDEEICLAKGFLNLYCGRLRFSLLSRDFWLLFLLKRLFKNFNKKSLL